MNKKILIITLMLGIWVSNGNAELVLNTNYCRENVLPNNLYAHPTDCRWFYKCIGGNTFPTPCTEDLAFDELNKSCTFIAIAINGAPPCTPESP